MGIQYPCHHSAPSTHLFIPAPSSSSAAQGSASSTESSSALDTDPSPTPRLPQHAAPVTAAPPSHRQQSLGRGHPSTSQAPASQFDSLHDLLPQAGYKETRVITPQSRSTATLLSTDIDESTSNTHSAATPSAAQQALASHIHSLGHPHQQSVSASQRQHAASTSATIGPTASSTASWLTSVLRLRRTTSTAVIPKQDPQQHRPTLPLSGSDPTISTSASMQVPPPPPPQVYIQPCSPQQSHTNLSHGINTLASRSLALAPSPAQHRPILRKRASRTSHALWTGSMAYRRAHTLAQHHAIPVPEALAPSTDDGARPSRIPRRSHTMGGPVPAAGVPAPAPGSRRTHRPRPSLHDAFAPSPAKPSVELPCPDNDQLKLSSGPTAGGDGTGGSGDVRERRAEFDEQYRRLRRARGAFGHTSTAADNALPATSSASTHDLIDSPKKHRPRNERSMRATSTAILMAHPALPVLSAAPAVALRHEACLIPADASSFALASTSSILVGERSTTSGVPSGTRIALVGGQHGEGGAATGSAIADSSSNSNPSAQQHGARRPAGLGRMRSVDLLREALDAMLRLQESSSEAPVGAAVDEVRGVGQGGGGAGGPSASSSTSSSLGDGMRSTDTVGYDAQHGRGQAASQDGPPRDPSLPKLFLSSPRGITTPQPIALDAALDAPADEGETIEVGGAGAGLGFGTSVFSLFGRGRSPMASKEGVAAGVDGGKDRAGSGGMKSADSVEAELDRILAGGRGACSGSSPTSSPTARRSRAPIAKGTGPGRVPMERRASSDSLEVIKPRRGHRGRRGANGGRRESVSTSSSGGVGPDSVSAERAGEGGSTGDDDAAGGGGGGCSSGSTTPSRRMASHCGGMSPSQLDRIEAALRGHAGSLSRARSVSALRSEVQQGSRPGGAVHNDVNHDAEFRPASKASSGASTVIVAPSKERGAKSYNDEDEFTIRKSIMDDDADNPFIDPTAARSAARSAESKTSSDGTLSESPVRKFLASLVELETPVRPFARSGRAVSSDVPVDSEGRESSKRVLCDRKGLDNVETSTDMAAGSIGETQHGLDKAVNGRIKQVNASPRPDHDPPAPQHGDEQNQPPPPPPPPSGPTARHSRLSLAQHGRDLSQIRGRRKTIVTIAHSDVRRRSVGPGVAPSVDQRVAATTTTTTTTTTTQALPSRARTTQPRHQHQPTTSLALSDLLDSRGRLRPHVVLVSGDDDDEPAGEGEGGEEVGGGVVSPTSTMLAQRARLRAAAAAAAAAAVGAATSAAAPSASRGGASARVLRPAVSTSALGTGMGA